MTAERRVLTFEVSTYFFRLATEAVRLHSNEIGRFTTLADLLEFRAPLGCEGLDRHAVETLEGHLSTIPSAGPLELDIDLTSASEAALLRARGALSERLGRAASLTEVLSVTLFDYVVERRAAEVLERAGIGDDPSPPSGESLPGWATNVLRLK